MGQQRAPGTGRPARSATPEPRRREGTPCGDAAEDPYDEAFARILATLPQQEVRRGEEWLRGCLLVHEVQAWWPAARPDAWSDPRFASPGFVEACCEEADRLGRLQPVLAPSLAAQAVTAAEQLGSAPTPALASDLRARAHGAYGEALRRAGKLAAAGRQLDRAFAALDEGTGEPLERADLLRRRARLERDRGDVREALSLLGKAGRIYRRLRDLPSFGGVLLEEARVLGGRDPEAALRRCEEALGLLDDPVTETVARLRLGWYLTATGRAAEALAMLLASRRLLSGLDQPAQCFRAWLEARIARRLGWAADAVPAYARAAAGWRELRRDREAALATLDQAEAAWAARGPAEAAGVVLHLADHLRRRRRPAALVARLHALHQDLTGSEPVAEGAFAELARGLEERWYWPLAEEPAPEP